MTSKLTRLTDDELTETLRQATSGYPLPASVEGNLRHAFAELQERRKAEKDSEPVAWIHSNNDIGIPAITVSQKIGHYWMAEFENVQQLYRHAQPVSEREQMAIENFRSAMEGIGHIRRTLEETFGGLHGTHVEPDVLMDCKTICDAIYAAYSGNSPVIPDGYRLQPISEYEAMCATVNSDEWPQRWIPVSERMPEDRTQVILWDAEIGEVTSGHYSHKTHTFYHCGDAIQNEITHWMPLPADPQEVNHG
ncbi:Eaa1 [Raoultella ornithinolytica]|uniref:DUF551 domain-containing protein n=1 Tax=Raoultella ornithinolytica TaxID=54291 RepID=UPI0007CD2C4D|nr:DUF551 domain-containing protein [Raoultella ornithinolytica]SBL37737.1 Eaa1 [Raoultella ornithinolytica]